MKKIKFTCSNCGAKLRVPTHLAGISAPCPKCGRKITAPTDLESIVDDDAPAKAKSRPPVDAPPQKVASPAPATRVEEPAPAPASPAPPQPAIAPVPPAVSAAPVVAETSSLAQEETTVVAPPEAPTAPAAPVAPEPAVSEEPIVEETLLAPTPEPEVPASEEEIPRPPVEETEPIQVRPLPGTLPEVRSEQAGVPGTLPRLDAERGLESPTGLDALISPPATPGAPTKLQLPEAGDLTGDQSPGDFIIPTDEASEISGTPEADSDLVLTPESGHPPEPVIPDLADLDMSAPGIPMEELGEPAAATEEVPMVAPILEDLEPVQELPVEEYSAPELEAPISEEPIEEPIEELAAPSLIDPEPEADVPADEGVGFIPPPPVTTATSSLIDLGHEEALPNSGGLSRGSMESLLSEQQSDSGHTAPIQPMTEPRPDEPLDEIESMFEAPPKPPAASAAESQSLEEMFGDLPDDPGKKKLTNVVMLSMIGAVAIIAIVVVVIGINAAGGLTPQITSNQTDITPPPRISEIPPTSVTEASARATLPPDTDTPPMIDPVAQERATENSEGIARSTTTLPGDTTRPVVIADDAAPATIETPAAGAPAVEEAPAMSFDERVQQIVNGSEATGSEMNIIGGEPPIVPSPLDSLDETIAGFEPGAREIMEDTVAAAEDAVGGAAAASTKANYNPPPAFAAPGPDDSPLGQTRDLLDAFLRAPDWQTRIAYTYQGESLRPAIEDYYKKWPVTSFDRYSLTLFQVEQDTSLGGPYWVYLVSLNDLDQGYPVIVRVEDGNLKVDWEIYSEFQDQHFAEFKKGAIASPHTFRLVIERVSDYFGSDRDQFTDLDNYLVYQINPPYGDLSEFSDYAFVKKGSALAEELDSVVGLNDEPLAVIITIEEKAFAHGAKHIEITDYVTEGWFR